MEKTTTAAAENGAASVEPVAACTADAAGKEKGAVTAVAAETTASSSLSRDIKDPLMRPHIMLGTGKPRLLFEFSTVGASDLFECKKWDNIDLSWVAEGIKQTHGDCADNWFDIILDVSNLGNGLEMSEHLGFHVDNLEIFANHDQFLPLLKQFLKQFQSLPSGKASVNCLIVDTCGSKPALGISVLLQYIVRSIRVCRAWPNIRHISDNKMGRSFGQVYRMQDFL